MNKEELFNHLGISVAEEMIGRTYSFLYDNGYEIIATVTNVETNNSIDVVYIKAEYGLVLLKVEAKGSHTPIRGLAAVNKVPAESKPEPLTVSYEDTQIVTLDEAYKRAIDISYGDSIILEMFNTRPYLIIAVKGLSEDNIRGIQQELFELPQDIVNLYTLLKKQ